MDIRPRMYILSISGLKRLRKNIAGTGEEVFEAYWQGKCLPQVRELIRPAEPL